MLKPMAKQQENIRAPINKATSDQGKSFKPLSKGVINGGIAVVVMPPVVSGVSVVEH
jgi:hypothetical protein